MNDMFDLEWDYDNDLNSEIRFSIYSTGYDLDTLREYHYTVRVSQLAKRFSSIISAQDTLNPDDEEHLIGIDSNSINSNNKNNIFLEWDKKHYLPNLDELKEFGGIITKTGEGYHLIKEGSLDGFDLAKLQEKMKCCPNFCKYTEKKGYSTLRVTPKLDNILHIIKYEDGLLYDIYKQLVVNFGGVYEAS